MGDMFNCLLAAVDCSQSDLRTVFSRVEPGASRAGTDALL